jgi:hypothetical protein
MDVWPETTFPLNYPAIFRVGTQEAHNRGERRPELLVQC